MKSRKNVPGTFLRIPLPDGTFGYGRQLEEPYTAFYDYRTSNPNADLEAIEARPVLFTQAVRSSSVTKWERIGLRALKGVLVEPIVRFHQEIGDFRKCVIYDNFGNERAAAPEECIGLERAAVWDAHHIEKRLLDTLDGRPNETEQRSRVRLK